MVWLFSAHHRSSSSSTTTTTTSSSSSSSSSSKPRLLLVLSSRSNFSKNRNKTKKISSSSRNSSNNGSSNKSNSSNGAKGSMGSTPVAFLIPEVLERILSFVPPRYRIQTRFVSKDWCRAATAHLDFSAHWVEHPIAKDYSETLQRLGVVTQFYYRLETMYYEEMVEVDVPWRRLRDRIVSSGQAPSLSNGSGSSRIRFFDSRGSIHVRSRLLPLFTTLPQLTRVRFEGCDLSRVTLRSLFRACPRLRILEILDPSERTLNLQQKGVFAAVSSGEEEQEGWHLLQGRLTRLERLSLHNTIIHPKILEDLILHSPSLNELSLTRIHAPEAYGAPTPTWTSSTLTSATANPTADAANSWIIDSNNNENDSVAFVDLLATSCPKLKSLKYDGTFFRRNEMNEALGPLTQLQHLDILPQSMARPLLMVIEPRIPTMTRLDLSWGPRGPREPFLPGMMRALHDFLCSAVSLEAFVCAAEVFDEQYLDLGYPLQCLDNEIFEPELESGQVGGGGGGSNIGAVGGDGHGDLFPFHSRNEVKVWGCRNLKELYLRIVPPRPTVAATMDPLTTLEDTRRSSRVLFGYISQVCPRLKKVKIDRVGLDCSLEGGLCLLTELSDLERLHVQVASFDALLNLWDFNWMAKEPTRLQRLADMMSTNQARFEASMRARFEWLGIPDCAKKDLCLIRARLRAVGLSPPEIQASTTTAASSTHGVSAKMNALTMTAATTTTTATAVRTFSSASEESTTSSYTAISKDHSERSKEDLVSLRSPTSPRTSGRRQFSHIGAGGEAAMMAIIPSEDRWPQLQAFLIEQTAGDRKNQQPMINGFIKKFRPEVQVIERE